MNFTFKIIIALLSLFLFIISAGCGGAGSVDTLDIQKGIPDTSGIGGSGTATLAWDEPTTNADGTAPLTDLAGYNVYFGTSSGNYTTVISVGTVTTYTVNNLQPNTYYFAITAYDTSGNESVYSNEESKTLP